MPLQHLRSSTAHKRPVPGNMSDGQLGINTNTGSPGLFFKDSNNALVKVGPVHVGTTAPNASPASGGTAGNSVGEQWLDTTGGTYVFKVWDGSTWRNAAGTVVDANGNINIDSNTLYVDAVNNRVGVGSTPSYSFHVTNSSNAVIACTNPTDSATGVLNAAGGGTVNLGTASNHPLTVSINSTEAFRVDTSRRLLAGTSSARSIVGVNSQLQLEGTSVPTSTISVTCNGDTPHFLLTRTGSASIGSNSSVANGSLLGRVVFAGADGTSAQTAAFIDAYVDGTPGANDMPGRLVLSTTSDNSSSPVERARITSDGYVRLASNSPGIQFNGDTAAANALNDYEEGTFTPTIVGTTGAGTGTYTNQIGRYTKIGDRVTFTIYLNWTAHTGTGNIRVSNLPFTSTSATGSFHAVSIYADGIPFTGPWLQAYVGVNSTNIGMGQMTAAGVVSGIPMDSAGDITITGHYEV